MNDRDTTADPSSPGAANNLLRMERGEAGHHLPLSVAFATLNGFLLILQAGCLARIVDGVIFRQEELRAVLPWLLALPLLFAVRALSAYLAERHAHRAAVRIKQRLRGRLYRHLQALGPAYLVGERSGEIATTLGEGVESLENYYARYLPAMALAVLLPLSILAFVLPMDWRSALVLILTAPLIPFFMVLIGRGAEKVNQRQWKQLARMGGHFLDVIQGLTTLKLFNASRREARVIARISDDYRVATMKVLRVAFLSALALEFFATVSIAIVAVLIGFRLLYGELDFQTGFFVLLLAPEFYLPLRSLGTHYHTRMEAVAAAERMLEVLDTPLPKSAGGRAPLPEKWRQIRFRDVHYSYPGDRSALAGVECRIESGECVALVGPSGAGKSTLVNMLLGFIAPDRGELQVDGASLSAIDLQAWRRQLAWVPQSPRLFHGTLRDNLTLGLDGIDEAAIWRALEDASALDLVAALPEGLDSVVGEGGRGLSGGELQRLVLARAFLRDAGLVLLDEPTASLDRESEQRIQQALQRLARSRTLLIVAHRLSTVERADRILVLDRGRVVEQGSHRALLQADGLYAGLLASRGWAG